MSAACAAGLGLVALFNSRCGQNGGQCDTGTVAVTLTFFTRHVRQPVLLRVYFGRFRWTGISAREL